MLSLSHIFGRKWNHKAKTRATTRLNPETLEERCTPTAWTWSVNTTADNNNCTVDKTNHTGAGSLRGCINAMNANAQAGDSNTIVWSQQQPPIGNTLTLTSSLPDISKNCTIDGPGAAVFTIKGGGQWQIFSVDNGVTATIEKLTLDGGNYVRGGDVASFGTTTLSQMIIQNGNGSTGGGGVYVATGGTAYVNDTKISNNQAVSFGGGVYNAGTLEFTGNSTCTLSNDKVTASAGSGGGLYIPAGALTIVACPLNIKNCSAPSAAGASGTGGGVYIVGDNVKKVYGTFQVNPGGTVYFNGDSATDGGGLYNLYGTVSLLNCTFASCSASDDGGGMYLGTGGSATFNNVTVDNTCSAGDLGAGVGFESKVGLPNGWTGLTDNKDPGGTPVQVN